MTFGNVSGLVGFIELVKSCNKDWIPLRAAYTVLFDQTNLKALQ